MATIFGWCPETSEGYYGSWANPDLRLTQAGFALNGQVTDHGFGVYARPAGNLADATALGILDRSINRIAPGSIKEGWTTADAAAWAAQHPTAVSYSVFQV